MGHSLFGMLCTEPRIIFRDADDADDDDDGDDDDDEDNAIQLLARINSVIVSRPFRHLHISTLLGSFDFPADY